MSGTPLVRQRAAELGVSLDAITGSGAGGRVTLADVEAFAPLRQGRVGSPVGLALTRTRTPDYSLVQEVDSQFHPHAQVRVDAYAANPLVDDFRQASPNIYAHAVADDPQIPTLFSVGDLPLFTASGIDPTLLVALPAVVRHLAAVLDGPDAAALFERCGAGDTYAVSRAHAAAAAAGNPGNPGWSDYVQRVQAWSEPNPYNEDGTLKDWATGGYLDARVYRGTKDPEEALRGFQAGGAGAARQADLNGDDR